MEDYNGDMDFKVAGTGTGLTALQLDVKIPGGLTTDMLREALERARIGRLEILKRMYDQTGGTIRKTLKPNCPVVEDIVIPVSKRLKMTRMGGYALRYT